MAIIKPDESVTIVGAKGSGKTTMLNYLIDLKQPKRHERIVILDTKQVGDFDRFPAVDELKNLHKLAETNPKLVYAPNRYELKNPDYIEAFLAWCYERSFAGGGTVCVIDELTQIVWGNDVPDSYKDMTDRGRAKEATIWQGNQKPVFVPHSALSEADHYFLYDLLVESDRIKMSGILGKKVLQRPIDPHGFWYFHRHMREPQYIPGIEI
jgi:energy-coupling factor transporter ATP-binding protein EcfA2